MGERGDNFLKFQKGIKLNLPFYLYLLSTTYIHSNSKLVVRRSDLKSSRKAEIQERIFWKFSFQITAPTEFKVGQLKNSLMIVLAGTWSNGHAEIFPRKALKPKFYLNLKNFLSN